MNESHDERGRFASGASGGSVQRMRRDHVAEGRADAQRIVSEFKAGKNNGRMSGERRTTEAGMAAWKAHLEANGFKASYERIGNVARASSGRGVTIYYLEARPA